MDVVRTIESRGYESIWLHEMFGREPFATAGFLLGETESISVGTAVEKVYVRDANATAQARLSLEELSGRRFMLGLGVSNARVNASRGHEWRPPLEKMTAYLDALEGSKIASPGPSQPCPTYIAARGPRLQALGAQRTDGVITYLMTPEHSRQARERIGPNAELSTFAMFLAETDPMIARRKARAGISVYVSLDYYHREWRKLGFSDADFVDGGSDRLIDTIVAWGDANALRQRAAAFERSGATRVIAMPLGMQTKSGIDWRVVDSLVAQAVCWGEGVARGDGRAVILVPGQFGNHFCPWVVRD